MLQRQRLEQERQKLARTQLLERQRLEQQLARTQLLERQRLEAQLLQHAKPFPFLPPPEPPRATHHAPAAGGLPARTAGGYKAMQPGAAAVRGPARRMQPDAEAAESEAWLLEQAASEWELHPPQSAAETWDFEDALGDDRSG